MHIWWKIFCSVHKHTHVKICIFRRSSSYNLQLPCMHQFWMMHFLFHMGLTECFIKNWLNFYIIHVKGEDILDIYSASKGNIYMHKIVVILKSSYKFTLIPERGISEIIFSRKYGAPRKNFILSITNLKYRITYTIRVTRLYI